jgi:hypothetical protein
MRVAWAIGVENARNVTKHNQKQTKRRTQDLIDGLFSMGNAKGVPEIGDR